MEINGRTIQLGIIGDPIGHSFSPQMHNFISKYMGNYYIYSAFNVKPQDLSKAIEGIRALNIRGVNVTAPHKINVMQYLDEISPDAKILGSVNTVVNNNGVLTGYNTDSEGFYTSLVKAGITVKNSNILVMGCGGVVIPTLIRIIKEQPNSITLLNRTKEKAIDFAEKIYNITGYRIKTDISNIDYNIIINTTMAGMEHNIDALPWDSIDGLDCEKYFNKNVSAVDMIYNPEETKFLKMAKDKGCKTLNGLGMLIYQGIIAYELFTDTTLPQNITELITKEVFNR